MSKFTWHNWKTKEIVTDLTTFIPPDENYTPVLEAEVLSKNGWYGVCYVVKNKDKFYLYAGNMDTGSNWKTPETGYSSISEAVEVAERLWRSI